MDCHKRKSDHDQLFKFYSCEKFTDHEAADCSVTKEKQAKKRTMKSLKKNRRKGSAAQMVESNGL